LGAWKLFGADAAYTVCANSIEIERVRELTGEVPALVCWKQASREDLPQFLREI
jgi:hypothetical protein